MKKELFNSMYMLDLSGKVEKDYKGLNYISWANAYKLAMEQDPQMTFEVLEDADGFPLFSKGDCHIVKTAVTMFGETKKMFLPVMDNKKNAVKVPDSRDVTDSIMRCLVKNIALFGIGLSLYVGEDLTGIKEPINSKVETLITKEQRTIAIKRIYKLGTPEEVEQALKNCGVASLDTATAEQFYKLQDYLKNKKAM